METMDMKKTILTIGRQYGSGGREIGQKIAEKLGYPLYDKEKLLEIAKKDGSFDEVRSFYQEKPVDSLLYAIAMSTLTQGIERKPFQEIKKIIEQEPCILIGRCGNYITKDRTDTLRVFIHADDKFRAERVAKENGITEEKAAKKIVETDKARASFYRFYTNGEWDQASGYDLVLNSSMFGIDQCVDMIIKSMDR